MLYSILRALSLIGPRLSMQELISHVGSFLADVTYSVVTFPTDIADYIYAHPKALDLDLQGIWISDRRSASRLHA